MNPRLTLLKISAAFLLTIAAAFGQAQQTNTNGVNIDTDGEANSFLTALARGTTITATELSYIDGATSNLQAQLNGKLATNGNGSALTGLTAAQVGLGSVENTALSTWAGSGNITTLGTITSGTVPVARISGLGGAATLSVGTTAGTVAAGNDGRFITDLGYTAATRILTSSTGADVTLPLFGSTDAGLIPASGGGTANFLRADGTWAAPTISGGLLAANNLSDLANVSTAVANLGLGNVDNTSDLNKPISTATQTALDGKLSLTGGVLTGNVESNSAIYADGGFFGGSVASPNVAIFPNGADLQTMNITSVGNIHDTLGASIYVGDRKLVASDGSTEMMEWGDWTTGTVRFINRNLSDIQNVYANAFIGGSTASPNYAQLPSGADFNDSFIQNLDTLYVDSIYSDDNSSPQFPAGLHVTSITSTTVFNDGNGNTGFSYDPVANSNAGLLTTPNINTLSIDTVSISTSSGDLGIGAAGNINVIPSGNVNITPVGSFDVDIGTLLVDTANNRVGINNVTPAFALDVTGDANLSGALVSNSVYTTVLKDTPGFDVLNTTNRQLYASDGITSQLNFNTAGDLVTTAEQIRSDPASGAGNFSIGYSAGGTTYAGIWLAQAAPDFSNYSFLADANLTYINSPTTTYFRSANVTKATLTSTSFDLAVPLSTTGNIELGHASDTTLSRSAAGKLAVEGVDVLLYSDLTSNGLTNTLAPLMTDASGLLTVNTLSSNALGAGLLNIGATTWDGSTITGSQTFSATPDFQSGITVSSGVAKMPSVSLGLQSIATAAGTTTLTVSSPYHTLFTGATTQTCVLPNATTLTVGQRYLISNNSTGLVTIQTNGGATLWTIGSVGEVELALTANGTAAGTWEVDSRAGNAASGKVSTFSNSITYSGTDGTTMTFPSTSATIARKDVAETFTGTVTAPNHINGFRTQATAAGTTTLVVGDAYNQIFTGSTTQTCVLPTTGVLAGHEFFIDNQSTGAVTVQSSGLNTILILAGATKARFVAQVNTPTTAANWQAEYYGTAVASGKKLTVSGTQTFTVTDGQTMTFPAATTTLAGLGTTQTFTGACTFNNASVLAGAATMSVFNTTATTLSFGGAATTLTIGGTPTTAVTHNYSTNATAAATTKTVNLGTGGAASSTTNVNIGDADGGTTNIASPMTQVNTYRAGVASPTQITADQNNYNPTSNAHYLRLSSDAARNITGLTFTTAQVDGQTHVITNVGSNNIVLVHESASSTAGNRFLSSTGADLTISANQMVEIWYDATTARWRASKRN